MGKGVTEEGGRGGGGRENETKLKGRLLICCAFCWRPRAYWHGLHSILPRVRRSSGIRIKSSDGRPISQYYSVAHCFQQKRNDLTPSSKKKHQEARAERSDFYTSLVLRYISIPESSTCHRPSSCTRDHRSSTSTPSKSPRRTARRPPRGPLSTPR